MTVFPGSVRSWAELGVVSVPENRAGAEKRLSPAREDCPCVGRAGEAELAPVQLGQAPMCTRLRVPTVPMTPLG